MLGTSIVCHSSMDCESGDIIKKGNDARGEEKGRLFREVVGIKKLHLGRVVEREKRQLFSSHRVAMFLREVRSRRSLSL